MQKPRKMVLMIGIAVLLVAAGAAVAATGGAFPSGKAAASIQIPPGEDFYSWCMKKAATQEQKDALNSLKHDYSLGWGFYQRDALMVVGKLPKGQRRLTLGEARQIAAKSSDERDMIRRFNEIAGAPDFEGGSGISRTIYFLNDDRTEAIRIMLPKVLYEKPGKDGKPIITELLTGGTLAPATTRPALK